MSASNSSSPISGWSGHMMVANDKADNDLTADRTAQLKALRDEWLDQMTLAQRRVGTPGRIFWREAPAEFFLAPIEVRR